MLISNPLAIEICSGGVESWATVTRVMSVMPKPAPISTGYPQAALDVSLLVVAIHEKNAAKMRKAKTVAHLTFFVMAQYKPMKTDVTIVDMNAMENRRPTMRKSFSYNTLICKRCQKILEFKFG
jgi:hypothetical protein